MTDLEAELDTATDILSAALNRYIDACSAIRTRRAQATTAPDIPWALSNRIVKELVTLSSHEAKLKQAAYIIAWVNNGPTVASINSLPPEILSRIFLFVQGFSGQAKRANIQAGSMPRYPDFLSHVCSHWRRIATDFPVLWTHIDLIYYHSMAPSYAKRAEVFATRAGDLPLNVHIHAPFTLDYMSGVENLMDFLPTIATRTESLALTRSATAEEPEPGILNLLLDILKPSTLRQLSLTEYGVEESSYIHPLDEEPDTTPEHDYQRLNMSHEEFNSALLPVQVLRLNGLYPYWESQAYRGLIELYLEGNTGREWSITAAQLHSIFTASPGLAILHLGPPILDHDGVRGIEPAQLQDLEVLDTGSLLDPDDLGTLLGLFTPGLKGLQLTMSIDNELALFRPNAAVTKFLKRSNVQRLHVIGLHTPFVIDDLLSLVPRLRALALRGYGTDMSVGPFISTGYCQRADPPAAPKLDTLYLLRGYFDLQSLRLISKICSPRTIILWGTDVCLDGGALEATRWEQDISPFDEDAEHEYMRAREDMRAAALGDHEVQEALSEFCPFVYHRRKPGSPIASWGYRED